MTLACHLACAADGSVASDWHVLFDAVVDRLRRSAQADAPGGAPGDAPGRAAAQAALREAVLECVQALAQLHAALASGVPRPGA